MLQSWKNFRKKMRAKKIARNQKTIKNSKAIREDRVAAIEFFRDFDDAEIAVRSLLERFEYSLEHGINDTREKESVMDAIKAFGEESLKYVEEHLRETPRIAWPIKVLMDSTTEERMIEILVGCLYFKDVSFDQSKVDKNYDILCYLRDYKLPQEECERLSCFVNDIDERVRFAAVELLIEQNMTKLTPNLEPFLYDETAENTRLNQAVTEAFVEKGWKLSDTAKFQESTMASRFRLSPELSLIRA